MQENKRKDPTIWFLKRSFVGLLLFSITTFMILGIYMNRKSEKAVYDVGEIYMSGMNRQMAKHFETVINLRFSQLEGIVSVVSPEDENLYEELNYRAKVRDFSYLAFCSTEGEFETHYGAEIAPLNPGPFVEALVQGENRVAVGMDSEGKEVLLFGVDASYPMENGELSTGLVVGVPLEYITDFLFSQDEYELTYYHILRTDGSFVIQNQNTELLDFFKQIQTSIASGKEDSSEEDAVREFSDALQQNQKCTTTLQIDDEETQICGIPLPCSEWYLVAVMPYGVIDVTIEDLGNQRFFITLLSCLAILLLLTWIFARYFSMTRQQLRELEESQKLAFESSKAKSEFLANMSHDIRTPMNAIVGMTAIAMTHADDREQVQNCLKKIMLSSKHLLGLINDVLDMSKIESGKLTLTTEIVSLRRTMEEIVSIMQPQVNTKKQNFDIHVDNIFVEDIWCDGVRLNQVLLNLLSNATKYTPEDGSICLSLVEKESPKGEDYVRIYISVKDTGIGMSQEFLGKIFESYSRADGKRIQKTEGTGLGMAITKYIVDAMEGTIDIHSELNKGTEVDVVFDVEKADTVEMDMVLPSWNMLIVDDDEMLCKTAVNTLSSIGIEAEWTLSGEQAIDMVIEHHRKHEDYQIILLDWKLPDINGIQVAREIRRSLGEEIPILLISAYDWSDFEAEAREAGINGFIAKPLFKSTLFHSLRQYMNGELVEEEEEEQQMDLSGLRILLAEDNELNWEVANELLSDLGVELEWAEDGKICLDKFRESPEGYYDAILMDIRMPHMTGYEATKAIRGLDHPDAMLIPIIAMSADAFYDDIHRCLECGMNAHIAKPIDIAELSRLLKRYVLNKELC